MARRKKISRKSVEISEPEKEIRLHWKILTIVLIPLALYPLYYQAFTRDIWIARKALGIWGGGIMGVLIYLFLIFAMFYKGKVNNATETTTKTTTETADIRKTKKKS